MEKLKAFWAGLKIKKKISVFTGSVLLGIIIAVFFVIWIVAVFLTDFNTIMNANAEGGEILSAIETERNDFSRFISEDSQEGLDALGRSIKETKKVLDGIDYDYKKLGDERFALLQSIITCYGVYSKERDQLLSQGESAYGYIDRLYNIYSMQDYLYEYAKRYADITLRQTNSRYNELLPRMFTIPLVTITINLLIIIVVHYLSTIMNHSITEPVLKLAAASRAIAANDFYIEDLERTSDDEMGELVSAFNKMKFATGEYIDALEEKRVALDQLHAKELETLETEKQLDSIKLELLKSQINPHFLFNTLNVIAGNANLEGAETTEKMIEALSSLFRYNLKTPSREVLLSRELKVAEDYMYLQKMRFGDRVHYEVDLKVDPEAVMVPTFILQPLLENCMIHGISPKVEGGDIRALIERDEDFLVIDVTDSGRGMSTERLREVRDGLEGKTPGGVGIGVGNIYSRIKKMYPGSDMLIDSTEGIGTKVAIRIPYRDQNTEIGEV